MQNPFIFGQVLPPSAPYCDRPELERAIRETAQNHQRLVLIGERRIGKSTLVERTLATDEHLAVTVDLLGLNSIGDFVERTRARIDEVMANTRVLVKRLPPAVRDACESVTALKVNFGVINVEARRSYATTIDQLLAHVRRISEWRSMTIFFDEFQEITDRLGADGYHVLGALRGAIQRQPNTTYLFAGSAKESLTDIFTASTSPFFKSARLLEVGPIPRENMEGFVRKQFAQGGRMLDATALEGIFLLAGDNPNDVQELCYHLWARSSPGSLGRQQLRDGFATLMLEVGKAGERVLENSTPNQSRALYALALRSGEADVFTQDFLLFSGLLKRQTMGRAVHSFTDGGLAILEKRAGKVQFRERFMRLWILGRILQNPSIFPLAMDYRSEWLKTVQPYVAPASYATRHLA